MQVVSTENNDLKDDVVLKRREAMPEVRDYLNDAFRYFEDLDYYIEDFFEASELFEVLNEDLPVSVFSKGRKQLISDMASLCELFFKRTESKSIRFQLEIVRTDMCRLFHVDNIRQRLLCTYIGPGTEWLDHSNVYRDALGKGCNDKIVRDFERINRARPFEVLILKGLKYRGRDLAVAHRSPPVEEDFKTRVLLKIDECQKD